MKSVELYDFVLHKRLKKTCVTFFKLVIILTTKNLQVNFEVYRLFTECALSQDLQ